jgi:hypothetical protein
MSCPRRVEGARRRAGEVAGACSCPQAEPPSDRTNHPGLRRVRTPGTAERNLEDVAEVGVHARRSFGETCVRA